MKVFFSSKNSTISFDNYTDIKIAINYCIKHDVHMNVMYMDSNDCHEVTFLDMDLLEQEDMLDRLSKVVKFYHKYAEVI